MTSTISLSFKQWVGVATQPFTRTLCPSNAFARSSSVKKVRRSRSTCASNIVHSTGTMNTLMRKCARVRAKKAGSNLIIILQSIAALTHRLYFYQLRSNPRSFHSLLELVQVGHYQPVSSCKSIAHRSLARFRKKIAHQRICFRPCTEIYGYSRK